MQNKLSKQLK